MGEFLDLPDKVFDQTVRIAATEVVLLGFLGPFAYFQITVYDVARGRVLRQEQITASRTISAGRSPTGDPWQVLSPNQKVQVLQKMLTEEIGKTLPRVVRAIF